MRNTVDGKHSRLEFDSIAEIYELTRKDYAYTPALSDIAYNSSFYGGVSTREEIWELATKGWQEELSDTLSVAEETLTTVEREHSMPAFQSYYDVAGADVDVARFLSGEPENMINYHLVETPRAGRVITLVVNLGASHKVKAKTMIERGRGVVALVYALEQIGLRTELYADSQTEGINGYTARTIVKIKDASETLDPAIVMFAYAHPAFFRGLILPSRHAHPEERHRSLKIGKSYGSSVTYMSNDVFPEGHVYVPSVLHSGVTNAKEFVVNHLKELGIID